MKFEEVKTQQLNSDGTDFWTGVGIGTGIVVAGAAVATQIQYVIKRQLYQSYLLITIK